MLSLLAATGSSSAAPALLGLLEDINAEIRLKAVSSLAWLRVREPLPAIARRLRDPDGLVRRAACWAIHTGRCRVPAPEIERVLQDAGPEFPMDAAPLLGPEGRKRALPVLLEGIASGDPFLRRGSVHAAARLGLPEIRPLLGSLLADGDEPIRKAALERLARIGGTEALPEIAGLLEDPAPEIRLAALQAVVRILPFPAEDPGFPLRKAGILPRLARLLADPEPEVRPAALEAGRRRSRRSSPSWRMGGCSSGSLPPMRWACSRPERRRRSWRGCSGTRTL